jgi:hypothetical protein
MSIEKKVQTDKHNAGAKKYSITRRDCNKLVFAICLRLSPAAIELICKPNPFFSYELV